MVGHGAMTRISAAALLLLITIPGWAADLSGPARVIDGDTLAIGNIHVRLWGIDAFELAQRCADAENHDYDCGQMAKLALETIIGGRSVECHDRGRDRYGRTVAQCEAEGLDLGGFMVRFGLALDWPRYSAGYYAFEQTDAQAARRGAWKGRFDTPWDWRHRRRGSE